MEPVDPDVRINDAIEDMDEDDPVIADLLHNLSLTLSQLEKRLKKREETKNQARNTPFLKPWMTDHILTFTLFWQVLNIVVLEIMDAKLITVDWEVDLTVIVMAIFQSFQLIFIVTFSIKLVKQVLHRTVTSWFLIQSYLSTILLYTGIYLLLFRIDNLCFTGIKDVTPQSEKGILHYIRLLYFSTSVMTSVGFGDVVPATWYSELLVVTEMLLSVTYVVVIFSLGIRHFSSEAEPTNSKNRQSTQP